MRIFYVLSFNYIAVVKVNAFRSGNLLTGIYNMHKTLTLTITYSDKYDL